MPGPPPKRTEERRRKNKPASGEVIQLNSADLAGEYDEVKPLPAGEDWAEPIQQIYQSAIDSMFSVWYQPSDWATLWFMCDEMNVEIAPRPVQIGVDADGDPTYRTMRVPMPGAKMSAFIKLLSSLLFIEGDRRRLQIELTNAASLTSRNDDATPATVTQIREGLWS